MAILDVVLYPDRRLKQVCPPAKEARVDREQLVRDLLDTMRAHPGCVGIAAPQIGQLARAVAIDVTGHRKASSCHGELVLFDTVVTRAEGSVKMREGCLSLPDLTGDVTRAERIIVEASSVDGAPITIEADAYECRVLLHELDHLDGILFLDRVASAHDIFPRKRYK